MHGLTPFTDQGFILHCKSKEFGPENGQTASGLPIAEKAGIPRILEIHLGFPEKTSRQSNCRRLPIVVLESYLVRRDNGCPVSPDKGTPQFEI